MGYFLLGICAGIIITGLAFSIICAKDFARLEELEEEEETEEDRDNDNYPNLW